MTWKEYENAILEYFKSKLKIQSIRKDVKFLGNLSKTNRQIDVLLEDQIGDISVRIAVECKNWQSKLDVADVGGFIDKLKDIGFTKGIMISKLGFTKAALQRALNEPDLYLQVVDFDKISNIKAFYASAYSGYVGVLLSAPSGFIIDSSMTEEQIKENSSLCLIYPMLYKSPLEAGKNRELSMFSIVPPFMWGTDMDALKKLFANQNQTVKDRDKKATVKEWEETSKKYGNILIREIYYNKEDYTEYTIGIHTKYFLSYCFMASKNDEKSKNSTLAKLKYIFNEAHFLVYPDIDPTNSHEFWRNLFNHKSF